MKTQKKLKKTKSFIESLEPAAGSIFVNTINKSLDICFQNSIFEGNEKGKMRINWQEFKDPMVQSGVKLMKEINDAGYEAYVVGGAVRDILMGDSNPHDIDIASNMPIDEIKKRYRTIEYGGGEKHGTVIVRFNEEDYEITQFRSEGAYSDSRRPDDVKFIQSFEEDTKRRDFTINAMGIDAAGNVIDYHGGSEDIAGKKLKTVGDPRERFGEDPLRILRAIRFAARFDFKVDDSVIEAIKELKDTVTTTSVERIRDELWKTIEYGGKKFGYALKFMKDTGLFETIFPEIELTDEKIEAVNRVNSNDQVINFAILLNDVSSKDAYNLGERITMTNPEKKSIGYIIEGLKLYPHLDKMPNKDIAMRIVVNSDFPKLRKTYIAINNSDVGGIEPIIEKYVEIASKQKEINKIIGTKGIAGDGFGKMVRKVTGWLFDNFGVGNLPGTEVIDKFIEENK